MLTNEQFERARRLGLRFAGIELCQRHREIIDRRCRRFGLCQSTLDDLLNAAEEGNREATLRLLRLLTTRHTAFDRHHMQFEIAARHALEIAQTRSRVRLWSAAAATGEEPYTLAISLMEAFDSESPPVTILATDIDPHSLSIAERGEYHQRALRDLPIEERTRYFAPISDARCRIAPSVRSLVEFRSLNLIGEIWPGISSSFDIIFCRNVLMYLEEFSRYAVLERMSSVLERDGLLILDPVEYLGSGTHLFEPVGNGVFANRRSLPKRSDKERLYSSSGDRKGI